MPSAGGGSHDDSGTIVGDNRNRKELFTRYAVECMLVLSCFTSGLADIGGSVTYFSDCLHSGKGTCVAESGKLAINNFSGLLVKGRQVAYISASMCPVIGGWCYMNDAPISLAASSQSSGVS